MVYTFSCPYPCRRVIMVDANDDDDAITKIIKSGALNCRNREKQSCPGKDYRYMSPLSEERIREIVRLSMKVEYLLNA